MGAAVRVEPAAAAHLLDAHLPGWDYADAFQVQADTRDVLAREVAGALLRRTRRGQLALTARDVAVRPFGVTPVATAEGPLFPVLHDEPALCVLGLDDRHLDFRVLVEVRDGVVRCTTGVRRHGGVGRLYFAVVGPFHRRLVPRLLRRVTA